MNVAPRPQHPRCLRARTARIGALATGTLGALVLLSACVQEVVDDRPQLPRLFDFGGALTGGLYPLGVFHGMNVIAELGPEDMPKTAAGEPDARLLVVIPDVREDGSEVYRVRGHRDVGYANGQWQVGHFRYTPRQGGRLYVLKERVGDLRFTFHGQPIVIETGSRWVPSLLYAVDEEKPVRGSGGTVRYSIERLEIGRAKIEVDGLTGVWRVNGSIYKPTTEAELILQDVVPHTGP